MPADILHLAPGFDCGVEHTGAVQMGTEFIAHRESPYLGTCPAGLYRGVNRQNHRPPLGRPPLRGAFGPRACLPCRYPNGQFCSYSFPHPAESIPEATISAARNRARALFSVSCHSSSATESATMPAAACTYSTPSFTTPVRIEMAKSILPLKPR